MRKNIFILGIFLLCATSLFHLTTGIAATSRSGMILLQVQAHGEAWYVYPEDNHRYYLGNPDDAFSIMKRLSIGARHDYIAGTIVFPSRLHGLILLDVESKGEAYYIHPQTGHKHYLGRPADALRVMSQLGQGISNAGLAPIPVRQLYMNAIDSSTIGSQVSFVAQAPTGEWNDPRQADGCEEASALMAVKWALGQSLSVETALSEIKSMSDFELRKYGEYRDTSAADTLNRLVKEYLGYQNAVLKQGISLEAIISELRNGNIIIAPINGQAVNNPNYRTPGPPYHMIVITGYDPARNVFITNDPGISRGSGFTYDADVLFAGLRDYPSGYRTPLNNVEKNVIVVTKQ